MRQIASTGSQWTRTSQIRLRAGSLCRTTGHVSGLVQQHLGCRSTPVHTNSKTWHNKATSSFSSSASASSSSASVPQSSPSPPRETGTDCSGEGIQRTQEDIGADHEDVGSSTLDESPDFGGGQERHDEGRESKLKAHGEMKDKLQKRAETQAFSPPPPATATQRVAEESSPGASPHEREDGLPVKKEEANGPRGNASQEEILAAQAGAEDVQAVIDKLKREDNTSNVDEECADEHKSRVNTGQVGDSKNLISTKEKDTSGKDESVEDVKSGTTLQYDPTTCAADSPPTTSSKPMSISSRGTTSKKEDGKVAFSVVIRSAAQDRYWFLRWKSLYFQSPVWAYLNQLPPDTLEGFPEGSQQAIARVHELAQEHKNSMEDDSHRSSDLQNLIAESLFPKVTGAYDAWRESAKTDLVEQYLAIAGAAPPTSTPPSGGATNSSTDANGAKAEAVSCSPKIKCMKVQYLGIDGILKVKKELTVYAVFQLTQSIQFETETRVDSAVTQRFIRAKFRTDTDWMSWKLVDLDKPLFYEKPFIGITHRANSSASSSSSSSDSSDKGA